METERKTVTVKRSRSGSHGPAKKVKKSFVALKSQSNKAERKTVDVTLIASATNFTSTGAFVLLNGMGQGSDIYQHQGRRIQMQSIRLKGAIYSTQAGAAPAPDYLRVIVFYDRQSNAAAPAFADLLTSVSNSGATSSTSIDPMNPNNYDRFQILMDQYWKVDCPAGAVANNQPATVSTDYHRWAFDRFIRLKNLETHFNANNNANVGDIQTGALYLFFAGLRTNANTQYGLSYQTRLRFTDL